MPSQKTASDMIAQDPSIFSMAGTVDFAESQDKDKQNLRLKLYDGSVNKHWYFGNLAFDLATMKLDKKVIAILLDHDTDKRMGLSTGAEFDPAFILTGKFLKNDPEAQKVRAQAQEGFPFEASLRFDLDNARAVKVAEGQTETVNGRKFQGPGTIFYDARIKEGSICTFGALKNCRSNVFIKPTKEHSMLTLEQFKTDQPDLYKQVFDLGHSEGQTAGEANERAIFTDLAAACGDDLDILVACYTEGKTVADALRMKTEKMAAENASLREQLAAKKTTTPAPPEDPAATEFSDTEQQQQDAAAPGKTETFMQKVEQYKAEHKCDQATAVDKCVDLYPDLHEQMRHSA